MNGTPSPMYQMLVSKMASDMKFVGIFFIIAGALNCLSIIGAIVGIPYIFMGIRVREAADSFNMFLMNNDVLMLEKAFEKQGKFFFIQKVLIIIGIVMFVVGIIMFIALSAYIIHFLQQAGYDTYNFET